MPLFSEHDAPVADEVSPTGNAAIADLTQIALIQAQGEDAVGFLHNLLSSDLKKLGPDAAQWSSFNTAQGRMLACFLVWQDADGVNLLLSGDLAAAIQKKLAFYVLRAKVTLAVATDLAFLGLAGTQAAKVLAQAGLPVPEKDLSHATADGRRIVRLSGERFLLVLAPDDTEPVFQTLQATGATPTNAATWQLAAIRAGVPLVTEAISGKFVPQMLNFELVGGVSFTKGCYPGQEIIARTQHLGKPKRRLYRLGSSGTAAPAGTPVYAEGSTEPVGTLVNVAALTQGQAQGFEALGVLQTAVVAAGTALFVGAPDGPAARVLNLPYELPV